MILFVLFATFVCMPTLTIPKEMMRKNDELVLVPRDEYEKFSQWRKIAEYPRKFKTFKPTKSDLQTLKKAREEYQRGEYTIIRNRTDLKHALGITSERSG